MEWAVRTAWRILERERRSTCREPTEHPEIVDFVDTVIRAKLMPYLITNGMFLENEELKKALLRPAWKVLQVQITNDPRYYPKAPPRIEDPRVTYVNSINSMLQLGRYKRREGVLGEVHYKYPASFNMRSLTRALKSFSAAVCAQRLRSASGSFSGQCAPNVTHEGDVLIGESRFCYKVGTVDSTDKELTEAALKMGSCNRCGLETNLDLPQKRAIGLSQLYGPNE